IFGIGFGLGLGRVGMAEDSLTDAVPDVAEVLVASSRGRLPAGARVVVVNGVLKKRVLVADDFLKSGAVHQRARHILGLAPRDVVEVIILEGAVEIVSV